MSHVVRLRCGHCAKRLTLDIGFIGSTCRCSHCGGLMIVGGKSVSLPVTRRRPESPVERAPSWWSGLFTRRSRPLRRSA